MSTKKPSRDREEAYSQWMTRSAEQRRHADTYKFIDDLWSSGTRLAASQSLHYQHVMEVIRSKITD